jgi:putative tricarboxylic transport membrane protein
LAATLGKKPHTSTVCHRKRANLIFSAALELLGILVIIESFKLGFQTFSNPGPGLFPFILGTLLCLLVSPTLIGALKGSETGEGIKEEYPTNLKKLIVVTACFLGFFFFLDTLGFLIITFFFLFGLFWIENPGKWLYVLALSVLVDAFAYLVFGVLLEISFPTGLLGIG